MTYGRGIIAAWAATSACWLLSACGAPPENSSPVPAGYPDQYEEIISQGEREGVVRIRSTTDSAKVNDLLNGFRRLYPRIKLVYTDTSATEIFDSLLRDLAAGRDTADILWSSAMDLQIKLVNDGYAQSYASPEAKNLPDWANWKSQAWGITAEPIVLVYNRRLIEAAAAPKTHLAFRRLLEARSRTLKGRVATYDPTRSAAGFLYLAQDKENGRDIWRMVRGFGANDVRLFATSEEIIADVAAGHSIVGYNVMGAYVVEAMRTHPNIALVVPRDYTLVMSRIAIIPARAPHPNAARLFLDYLLSKKGQTALALHSMHSVRTDVAPPASLPLTDTRLRAIRVGPGLLVQQDRLTRQYFMNRWHRELQTGHLAGPDKLRP